MTTNYEVAVKFEAPGTEENMSKINNPNRTEVIQKLPQVGQTKTHKTKILLKLTAINPTHRQDEKH